MAEVGICLIPGASKVEACHYEANDIEYKCQRINDKNWGGALISFGEKKEDDEEYNRGSYLGAKTDADLGVVVDEVVEVGNGDIEGRAVGLQKGE